METRIINASMKCGDGAVVRRASHPTIIFSIKALIKQNTHHTYWVQVHVYRNPFQ